MCRARRIPVFTNFILFLIILTVYPLTIKFWGSHIPTLAIPSDEAHFNHTLKTILIPRWVQSEGHRIVFQFINEELLKFGYTVILNKCFEPLPLTNVIAVSNDMSKRFLLLSCHYDSKYLISMEDFVSAIDAGISCAILINMAKTLATLTDLELFKRNDVGLILAFFDGHESFEGTHTGFHPLYGSEHFVQTEVHLLKRINEVITLNLIGDRDPLFFSRYQRTFSLYERLADAENDLRDSGQQLNSHKLFYKTKTKIDDAKMDDHVPFLGEDLPVLHIVPRVFPDAFFQSEYTIDNMHWPTVRNMNAILTRFVYDYFKHYNSSEH